MKMRWIAVALALWAGPALAQTYGSDGTTQSGSFRPLHVGGSASGVTRVLQVDGDGNLYVNDAGTRDAYTTFTSIIANAALAPGAADSSAILDTHELRHLKLLIKAVPLNWAVADSAKVMKLVFQIRTHLNGAADSNSTFAEYQYGNLTAMTTSATGVDTLNVGHLLSGNASLPWSGEFTVTIELNRNAHGDSRVATGELFYYPSGISLSLDSVFGRDFWAPYMSIRVRNILLGFSTAITCHLIGTPL